MVRLSVNLQVHTFDSQTFITSCFRAGHKAACKRMAAEAAAGPDSEVHVTLEGPNLVKKILAIEAVPARLPQNTTKFMCGFCLDAKEKLLLCGKCKIVRYCSADHQRQHWFDNDLHSFCMFIDSFVTFFCGIITGQRTSWSAAHPSLPRLWP